MALQSKTLDPVTGLVEFVKDTKPYHTKIIEVLVEYIYTDVVNVDVSEALDFCINLGAPTLNSIFEFDIISTESNTVVVNGDVSNYINQGQAIEIGLTNNIDGRYHVASTVYDSNSLTSTITITSTLIYPTYNTGKVANSFIDYCTITGMTDSIVLDTRENFCHGGYANNWTDVIFLVDNVDYFNNKFVFSGNKSTQFIVGKYLTVLSGDLYSGVPNSDVHQILEVSNVVYDLQADLTHVYLVEPILQLDAANTYYLFASDSSMSGPLDCVTDGFGELVYAQVLEDLSMDITINLTDDVYAYNLENLDEGGWDSVRQYTLVSNATPVIHQLTSAPSNPTDLELWYDLINEQFKQWQDYRWTNIVSARWFDTNTSKTYQYTLNQFVDTGWIEIFVTPDKNSRSWGAVFDATPNTISFDHTTISVNVPANHYIVEGGNFIEQLKHNTVITIFAQESIIGEQTIGDFPIASISATSFQLDPTAGDLTATFIPGSVFLVTQSTANNKYFTVSSSTFSGTATTIETVETINQTIVTSNMFVGSGLGVIPSAVYVPASNGNEPVTLLVPNTPVHSNVYFITFNWAGPLQLDIGIASHDSLLAEIAETHSVSNELSGGSVDVAETTVSENLSFGWGDVSQWFQYTILESNDSADYFSVYGDPGADIQPSQQIRVLGNNTSNAGIFTVSSVVYDGVNTKIFVNEDLQSTDIGFIEPVDILPMSLFFTDSISVTVTESANSHILDGGSLIGSFDYGYFDVGQYDGNIETLVLT